MYFRYQAKSLAGDASVGVLEADSDSAARQMLRERGLFPVALKGVRGAVVSERAVRRPHRRRSRITRNDLLMLTSQLSIMCRSGIDLAEALQNSAEQCVHTGLKGVLKDVYDDVSNGKTVSSALRRQSHVFGETYVASIAAGEASGRVSEVLNRLVELQRAEIRLRTTLTSVLTYPLALIGVSFLVLVAMIYFVLPQFAGVFADMEIPAPPLTQLLLDGAQGVREYSLPLAAVLGLLGIAGFRLRKDERLRRYWDGVVLNGIVLRDLTRALLIGRTFQLLGTMLHSGVPLLDSIRLCRSSVRNSVFRELFQVLEESVLNGRGIASTLSASRFVPPGAAQMVTTAEKTGKLGPVMQTVGEFYEEDGQRRLRELAKMIEPAIIVAMGLFVALIVMSIMLPILDFSSVS